MVLQYFKAKQADLAASKMVFYTTATLDQNAPLKKVQEMYCFNFMIFHLSENDKTKKWHMTYKQLTQKTVMPTNKIRTKATFQKILSPICFQTDNA